MDELARLRAIIETQAAIHDAEPGLDNVMRLVAQKAQELTVADAAVVELAEGDDMVYAAATGNAEQHLGLRLSLHTSLSGLSVRLAQVLCCADVEVDDRVDREACRRVGVRSMVVAPLVHRSAALGVLKVMSGAQGHFSEDDMTTLESLAGFVATAVSRARHLGATSHRAMHDELTGLPNRALLRQELDAALARTVRNGTSVGLLYIDLDGFKPVNDTYGHAAGDAVLVATADRLRTTIRAGDTAARVGGDEFAVLCENRPSVATRTLADRVRALLRQPVPTRYGQLTVAASIGAATAVGQERPESLIARADAAMYAEKRQRQAA